MRTFSAGFILLTLSFTGAVGQTLTIQELIDKALCRDFTCFNDFITARGFSFVEKADLAVGKMYRYQSNQRLTATSNESVTSTNQAGITFHNDGSIGMSFGTSVQYQYRDLISELGRLGFIASQSVDEKDGVVVVNYKSPRFTRASIFVRTMTVSKKDLGSWIYYDFQLLMRS